MGSSFFAPPSPPTGRPKPMGNPMPNPTAQNRTLAMRQRAAMTTRPTALPVSPGAPASTGTVPPGARPGSAAGDAAAARPVDYTQRMIGVPIPGVNAPGLGGPGDGNVPNAPRPAGLPTATPPVLAGQPPVGGAIPGAVPGGVPGAVPGVPPAVPGAVPTPIRPPGVQTPGINGAVDLAQKQRLAMGQR
jgi:hypothetical protein